MKKVYLVAILFLILLIPTTSMARTDFFLNIGLGIPLPYFIAPTPVVFAPPPIFVAPAPVFVPHPVFFRPAPVIYGPPGWYIANIEGGTSITDNLRLINERVLLLKLTTGFIDLAGGFINTNKTAIITPVG